VGEAARRIQSGDVDVMLAGGAEAPLTFGVLRAWEAMRTIASPDPRDPSASCRPFARNRTGLVLGEGAAFVALEEWNHATGRGARIHAELTGYGLTTDTAHITRPTVEGQAGAMRAALKSAGLGHGAVDYVNAHGTATLQNDAVETAAIKEVFGARAYALPVSSTKSMHGHLLGAAGALEFVIAVASMERGIVPPTMHLELPDPACDLDYVPERARTGVNLTAVMSNSFAFGGTNAVLIAEALGVRR
jgi:3-oxoacyl-[acyl-carrier-protein] synthase II